MTTDPSPQPSPPPERLSALQVDCAGERAAGCEQLLVWPPDRFLWALLEVPAGLRAREREHPLPEGLIPDLVEQLPLPLDQLHAVGVPAGPGRMLVCAARQTDLAQVGPHARSLRPAALPDGVPTLSSAQVDPARIELLVGGFEPRFIRRARTRRHAAAMVMVVALTALLATGLVRRARADESVAHETRAAAARLHERMGTGDLGAELARIQQLNLALQRFQPGSGVPDPVTTLARVLKAWPDSADADSLEPQSVLVTTSGVSINARTRGSAAEFLEALRPVEGWTLEEPRMSTTAGGGGGMTRLSLQLHPAPAGATP